MLIMLAASTFRESMSIENPPRPSKATSHFKPHSTPHAHSATPRVRPALVLTVVLVAALAINVETTIVNVALPTLNVSLGASTRGLQWIVDAYNLAFAALVLAGGTVGDQFGRRGTLIAGLGLFAASSVAAALCTSPGPLIGARLVMGVASALIYPTTLALITDTFREPRQRAAAIGVWGAVTGLGVAIGPILGGARAALRALGRRTTVVPGALGKLLTASLKTLPRRLRSVVLGRIVAGMREPVPPVEDAKSVQRQPLRPFTSQDVDVEPHPPR